MLTYIPDGSTTLSKKYVKYFSRFRMNSINCITYRFNILIVKWCCISSYVYFIIIINFLFLNFYFYLILFDPKDFIMSKTIFYYNCILKFISKITNVIFFSIIYNHTIIIFHLRNFNHYNYIRYPPTAEMFWLSSW